MQVITANRLDDGRVVYLTAADGWSVAIAEARRLADAGAVEAALVVANAAAARQEILDPYAVAVAERAEGWVPAALRERIRAFGPTSAAETA